MQMGIIMKIKALLLILVIALTVAMLPSCTTVYPGFVETTSPSQTRADLLEQIKQSKGEFRVYDVAGFIGNKYIFKNKKGIFRQKNSHVRKPPAIARNRYMTSYMANPDFVFYTVYEDEKDPKGKKLLSPTQLFCVRTDGSDFKKLAVFNYSRLTLLGYHNGTIYFKGNKSVKTSSETIFSYSFKTATLSKKRSGLKNVVFKSKYVYYNYYYTGAQNTSLYAMSLDKPDQPDVKITDSAYCKDYSNTSDTTAFWSHNIGEDLTDIYNKDHYFYVCEGDGSVRKSVKFPDSSLPLAYVAETKKALVYTADTKPEKSGVYLWDTVTGDKELISNRPIQHGLQRNIDSKFIYFIFKGSGSLEDSSKIDAHIVRFDGTKLSEMKRKRGKNPDYTKGTIIIDKWVRYDEGKLKSYRLFEDESFVPATAATEPATTEPPTTAPN